MEKIQNKNLETCYIFITGMSCVRCINRIQDSLLKVEGLEHIEIALLTGKANAKFNPEYLSPSEIVTQIKELGFGANLIDSESIKNSKDGFTIVDLHIEGMTCASCVYKIEKECKKLKGVLEAKIALATNTGIFKFDANTGIGVRDIMKKIGDLGFKASLLNDNKTDLLSISHKNALKKWRNGFIVSVLFGAPSMIAMLLFAYLVPDLLKKPDEHHHVHNETSRMEDSMNMHTQLLLLPGLNLENLLMFVFCTPVQFFVGRHFYRHAFAALKQKTTNMDVLIALSTTIAYVYSIVVVIVAMIMKSPFSPTTFFDTPPMIIIFISLGRWLEHITKGKTSDALGQLLSLQPLDGCLVSLDSEGSIIKEEIINAKLIKQGDLLKVTPGSKIPVDGKVVQGQSMCDESIITGESMPVNKKVGSIVIGGTLNQNGIIILEATHVGKDTALSQIVRLVEEAQTSKAPIQQIADRIASFFVPMVCVLSLLTLLIWTLIGIINFDLIRDYSPYHNDPTQNVSDLSITFEMAFQFAITVLSVSCPCALGLATPTAVMVGTGAGAKSGILIKGGEPLETAYKLKTIVFDKTGTITQGVPSVSKFFKFLEEKQFSLFDFLNLIASAESNSEHSLGKAVVDFCKSALNKETFSKCTNFEAVPGFGLKARVAYKIGEGHEFNSLG
jgi:Cu+-exporting ATPase